MCRSAFHRATAPWPASLSAAVICAAQRGQRRAVDVARTRQRNRELAADAAGMRRHQQHPVAEADRLAHVVRHEDDRLAALRPDALDVAVELLARHRVERGERLVHQQHARVGRERAGQRDALLHAAGELVHVGARRILRGRPASDSRARSRAGARRLRSGLQLQPEHDVADRRSATETAPPPGTSPAGRGPAPSTGLPSASTRPESGLVRPAMMSSSVDLPQPRGPTRQTNSPSPTSSEMSSSAWTSPLLLLNRFDNTLDRQFGWVGATGNLPLHHGVSINRDRSGMSLRNPTFLALVMKVSNAASETSFVGSHARPCMRDQIGRDVDPERLAQLGRAPGSGLLPGSA